LKILKEEKEKHPSKQKKKTKFFPMYLINADEEEEKLRTKQKKPKFFPT
jgi:hypothetical protein